MTNLDIRPAEIDCRAASHRNAEVIAPRDVPLGGIRAMTVRRTLPARGRPFIGSWCFLDHYGPDEVAHTGGMNVPPHPHCGLQTVSWLFRGEIEHRDSLGTHALVLPGELNLMTAGHGIAHSEVSTPATSILHGVQLWVALPREKRDMAPAFQHYSAPSAVDSGVTWRVFLGELGGQASPVPTASPLLGAELAMAAGSRAEIALQPEFEHGVLIDEGSPTVDGIDVAATNLVALPVGRDRLRLTAGDVPCRILLIGGTPMESDLVMWWNFVGGTHEEIVAARSTWQAEIGAEIPSRATGIEYDDVRDHTVSGEPRDATRFGTVLGYNGPPLPAPRMPGGRLKPRNPR
jgi:redox-sensitive bicupin YhaK (pirin superfamily)